MNQGLHHSCREFKTQKWAFCLALWNQKQRLWFSLFFPQSSPLCTSRRSDGASLPAACTCTELNLLLITVESPKSVFFGWTLDDPAGCSRAACKKEEFVNLHVGRESSGHQQSIFWSRHCWIITPNLKVKSNSGSFQMENFSLYFLCDLSKIKFASHPFGFSYYDVTIFICEHCHEACHRKWALPFGWPDWFVVFRCVWALRV